MRALLPRTSRPSRLALDPRTGHDRTDAGGNGFGARLPGLHLRSRRVLGAAHRERREEGARHGPIGFCPEYAMVPTIRNICRGTRPCRVLHIVNNTASAQSYHCRWPGCPRTRMYGRRADRIHPSAESSPFPPAHVGGDLRDDQASCRPHRAGRDRVLPLTFRERRDGRVSRPHRQDPRGQTPAGAPPRRSRGGTGAGARAVGTVISFPVENPCDPVALAAYSVRARYVDEGNPDPTGIPTQWPAAGQPVTGFMSHGSQIDVSVAYPQAPITAALRDRARGRLDADGVPRTWRACS